MMAISLMAFDYDFVYQNCRTIPYADAMSCLQNQINDADELQATNVYKEVNFATCKAISIIELEVESLTYPMIQTVMKRSISDKGSECF